MATTTILDLPDDMLHEIFERVFAGEPAMDYVNASEPPSGTHLALRRVCRRWRDIADWVRLSTSQIGVDPSLLADAGAVRARHPAALKRLVLAPQTLQSLRSHSTSISRATASLVNGSADLRRALVDLELQSCCLPAIVPAVTPIASCTALTRLSLYWGAHEKERAIPSNMLAPLSALQNLDTLCLGYVLRGQALPESALLAPPPALPDAPRLTSFLVAMAGNFVPVGSDAALGRLRKLVLLHKQPVQELVDAEDPFLLRTAFDAGTWQPSRLTGLQELELYLGPVRDSRAPVRPSPTGSPAGSEWAPLAGQLTKLFLRVTAASGEYRRPSTGIIAGLGVLTALRNLGVSANFSGVAGPVDPGLLELASIDRVRATQLTHLVTEGVSSPVNVARFPNLVHLGLMSLTRQPPLNLRSLLARASLKTLDIVNPVFFPSLINLAELFVGGAGWPVLKSLRLKNAVLEWDTTGLSGAPTAAEFGERARQLLPVLVDVKIDEPSGRGALADRSRVAFVVECRRHVVPALEGLHAGGR